MKKCLYVCGTFALVLTAACTKSSPSRPSSSVPDTEQASSSVTDAKTGVTLTTPVPLVPASNAALKWAEQPITLTARNGVSTGSTALTYTFQVASDGAFASIVSTKENVPQGAGQTSVQLDKLAGAKTYYWRVRSNSGSAAGLFSGPRVFNVGPEIVIQPPALSFPTQGGTLNGSGSLTVTNSSRTGPAGRIFYRFEVSDSSSFGNLVFTSTVGEGSGQTSAQLTARLTNNATYFWRVQAQDPANGVTSAYSQVLSFKYVPFDMREATIQASPADLGFWPETAKITYVNLAPDGIQADFDKRDSADRWPDEPFGSGSIQYTLGMCLFINNHWYCSAVVQFWYGRDLSAGGRPDEVSFNWFYDPARWGAMTGYQPSRGETVGIFVGAGNLRGRTDPGYVTCPRVCERSNVVLIPWSEDGSGVFTFGSRTKFTIK
jgi:hypothetical protein